MWNELHEIWVGLDCEVNGFLLFNTSLSIITEVLSRLLTNTGNLMNTTIITRVNLFLLLYRTTR
jgi:hypothetical protein